MRNRTLGFWAIVALGAAVLLWVAGWAVAGTTAGPTPWGMGPGMMPWMGGPLLGGPAMLLMLVSMLLFWVAPVLGLVLLVRWLVEQTGGGRSTGPDALEEARRRYARGEIDREAFERLRDDLLRDR